jgi:hypothetical protein
VVSQVRFCTKTLLGSTTFSEASISEYLAFLVFLSCCGAEEAVFSGIAAATLSSRTRIRRPSISVSLRVATAFCAEEMSRNSTRPDPVERFPLRSTTELSTSPALEHHALS